MPRCARRWRPRFDRGSRSPRAGLCHCGARAGPAYGGVMRNVPWWGVLSSAAAPVLLAGGSTIAATLQPPSFDPVTDTVSALAAVGAVSRWLMTATFLAVGACDVITGLALRPASAAGRLILVAGGRGRHAGRGLSPAGWRRWLTAARDLGVGRLRRARGLAGRGMAAWPGGAVGAAAGGVCRCRRGACLPPGVVRRRGGHRGRTGWPGRGGPWRGSGGMAADGSPVLPPPRQDGRGPGRIRGQDRQAADARADHQGR